MENILDLDQSTNKKIDIRASLASAGQRLANVIIDSIAYMVLTVILLFVFGFLVNLAEMDNTDEAAMFYLGLVWIISVYAAYILYYWIMEATFGKTVGKFITKTRVVNRQGQQPSWANILGRSACRFIPFEVFSFLGRDAIGWHDSISHTYVINDNPRYYPGE